MTKAQIIFITTSWLFLILSALLFLIPTQFASSEAAAWTSLGIAIASHIILLVALAHDWVTTTNTPDAP